MPSSRVVSRIDVHHHYAPPYEGVDRAGPPFAPENGWSPAPHLAFMDRWGIEAAVLSDPAFALVQAPTERRRQAADRVNAYNAELLADHGDRFGVFAAVPLPDVAEAIPVAERALTTFGLDGICLATNYSGRYLGHSLFDPLYEALDDHGAVVFVHPTAVPTAPAVSFAGGELGVYTLEFVFDTTRTVTSLAYSGVMDRYPNIRWIFCHCGGALPFLAFRLAGLHAFDPRFNEVLPNGPTLRSVFLETAQAFGVSQLSCAADLVSNDRLLFGTDYPLMRSLYEESDLERVPLRPGQLPRDGDPAPTFDAAFGPDRQKVERSNATALLPRLAQRLETNLDR